MSGVQIEMYGQDFWNSDRRTPQFPEGLTDHKGQQRYRLGPIRRLNIYARLPGYHTGEGSVYRPEGLGFDREWHVECTIRMVPIRDPQPYLFLDFVDRTPPLGEPWDFDLIRCDWMPPYGAGRTADVQFRPRIEIRRDGDDCVATLALAVVFPEGRGGILPRQYTANVDVQMDVRRVVYPRLAPADGYVSEITLPRQARLSWKHDPQEKLPRLMQLGLNPRIHFFRIRGRQDADPDEFQYGYFVVSPDLLLKADSENPEDLSRASCGVHIRTVIMTRSGRSLESDSNGELDFVRKSFYPLDFWRAKPAREDAKLRSRREMWWTEIYWTTGQWIGDGQPREKPSWQGDPVRVVPMP